MWTPHIAGAEPLPLSQRQSRLLAVTIVLSVVVHAAALHWLPGLHGAAPSASAPEVLQVSFQAAVPLPQPVPIFREQRTQPLPGKTVSRDLAAAPILTAPAREAAPIAIPHPTEASPPLAPAAQPETPEAAVSPAPPRNEAKKPPAQPVSEPDYRAAYLDNPRPSYPLAARRQGLEGRVLLRVEVLADGSSGRVEVKSGSGYEVLDRGAREAVKTWRFVPARRGGEALVAWVDIPIAYRLEN
jgi:protein TonB